MPTHFWCQTNSFPFICVDSVFLQHGRLIGFFLTKPNGWLCWSFTISNKIHFKRAFLYLSLCPFLALSLFPVSNFFLCLSLCFLLSFSHCVSFIFPDSFSLFLLLIFSVLNLVHFLLASDSQTLIPPHLCLFNQAVPSPIHVVARKRDQVVMNSVCLNG